MIEYEFSGRLYLIDTDDTFFDTDKKAYSCLLNIRNGICSILTDEKFFVEFEYTDISFNYGIGDDIFISVESSPFFYNFTKKKPEILMTEDFNS